MASNIEEKLEYLDQTKQLIRQSIVNKGQEITDETPFREYVNKIDALEVGGSGDVKLFTSQEEMRADAEAKEGDLAEVYSINTNIPSAIGDTIDFGHAYIDLDFTLDSALPANDTSNASFLAEANMSVYGYIKYISSTSTWKMGIEINDYSTMQYNSLSVKSIDGIHFIYDSGNKNILQSVYSNIEVTDITVWTEQLVNAYKKFFSYGSKEFGMYKYHNGEWISRDEFTNLTEADNVVVGNTVFSNNTLIDGSYAKPTKLNALYNVYGISTSLDKWINITQYTQNLGSVDFGVEDGSLFYCKPDWTNPEWLSVPTAVQINDIGCYCKQSDIPLEASDGIVDSSYLVDIATKEKYALLSTRGSNTSYYLFRCSDKTLIPLNIPSLSRTMADVYNGFFYYIIDKILHRINISSGVDETFCTLKSVSSNSFYHELIGIVNNYLYYYIGYSNSDSITVNKVNLDTKAITTAEYTYSLWSYSHSSEVGLCIDDKTQKNAVWIFEDGTTVRVKSSSYLMYYEHSWALATPIDGKYYLGSSIIDASDHSIINIELFDYPICPLEGHPKYKAFTLYNGILKGITAEGVVEDWFSLNVCGLENYYANYTYGKNFVWSDETESYVCRIPRFAVKDNKLLYMISYSDLQALRKVDKATNQIDSNKIMYLCRYFYQAGYMGDASKTIVAWNPDMNLARGSFLDDKYSGTIPPTEYDIAINTVDNILGEESSTK